MGLKVRKIKSMLELHYDQCVTDLNNKLGTNFTFDMNWDSVPSDVDGWNWEDDDLRLCFYNSYFMPLEKKFHEMFQDPMYKEEIQKQIQTISIQPGSHMYAEYDFENGTFFVKNTLGINQKNPEGTFEDSALKDIQNVIDSKLS